MLSQLQQAQLTWRCRRGMLELDLLLQRFCEQKLAYLTAQEAEVLQTLLTWPDPDLLACLMGKAMPVQGALGEMVALIQSCH